MYRLSPDTNVIANHKSRSEPEVTVFVEASRIRYQSPVDQTLTAKITASLILTVSKNQSTDNVIGKNLETSGMFLREAYSITKHYY